MHRRILYVQYTNPAIYPPLEHSSRILAEQGWQVLFLGIGAWGADVLRFPEHPRIAVRRWKFVPAGWKQKLHYLGYCLWALGWTLHWRPQWIYASDSLASPLALVLSFFPRIRVIYHEHDAPPATAPSFFFHLCLEARRRLAKRASLCIIPNDERAKKFIKDVRQAANVHCVWNCPAREEVAVPRSPLNRQGLWLLYHGSIVPVQFPRAVLEAMAQLPDAVKLRVAGYETLGHGGYVKELQELSRRLGISHRCHFAGPAPTRRELLEGCRQCDVGLALFPAGGRQPMVGASNKPFDYLASGLALLVSDLPDWRQTYVEAGYGRACNPDDSQSIADALRWFLDHPEETRAMGERGRRRILADWNYETQFTPVLQRLVH